MRTAPAKAGPGRPKGSANKLTVEIKTAILNAFDKAGGEEYLAGVAKNDPRTFCALLGRVLPLQVAGDPNGTPVQIEQIVRWES